MQLEQGKRYRGLGTVTKVAGVTVDKARGKLEEQGFQDVRVWLAPGELPSDWPANYREDPSGAFTDAVWIEATWAKPGTTADDSGTGWKVVGLWPVAGAASVDADGNLTCIPGGYSCTNAPGFMQCCDGTACTVGSDGVPRCLEVAPPPINDPSKRGWLWWVGAAVGVAAVGAAGYYGWRRWGRSAVRSHNPADRYGVEGDDDGYTVPTKAEAIEGARALVEDRHTCAAVRDFRTGGYVYAAWRSEDGGSVLESRHADTVKHVLETFDRGGRSRNPHSTIEDDVAFALGEQRRTLHYWSRFDKVQYYAKPLADGSVEVGNTYTGGNAVPLADAVAWFVSVAGPLGAKVALGGKSYTTPQSALAKRSHNPTGKRFYTIHGIDKQLEARDSEVQIRYQRGALFYFTVPADRSKKGDFPIYVVTELVTGKGLRVISFKKSEDAKAFVREFGDEDVVHRALLDAKNGETKSEALAEFFAIVQRVRQSTPSAMVRR